MARKRAGIGSVAALLIGWGLSVSNFDNNVLAAILILVGLLLGTYSLWPYLNTPIMSLLRSSKLWVGPHTTEMTAPNGIQKLWDVFLIIRGLPHGTYWAEVKAVSGAGERPVTPWAIRWSDTQEKRRLVSKGAGASLYLGRWDPMGSVLNHENNKRNPKGRLGRLVATLPDHEERELFVAAENIPKYHDSVPEPLEFEVAIHDGSHEAIMLDVSVLWHSQSDYSPVVKAGLLMSND